MLLATIKHYLPTLKLYSIKHTPHTHAQLHVMYAKFDDLLDIAAHAENVYTAQ